MLTYLKCLISIVGLKNIYSPPLRNSFRVQKCYSYDRWALLQQLAEVNQEGRARSAAVREKRDFLQTEEHNNRECERRISRAERQASELRQDLQEQELHRSRLQHEVPLLLRLYRASVTKQPS